MSMYERRWPALVGLCLMGWMAASPASARTGVDIWSQTILHPDGSRTVSKKDLDAKVINQETYNSSGSVVMKRVYQLDAEGKEQRGFVFDAYNNLIYRIGYLYDEIDRLKEEVLYNTHGQIVRRQIYEYNRVGQLIRPVKAYTFEGAIPQSAVRPERAMMSAEEMSREDGSSSMSEGAAKEKKPGIFKRIFGKKNKKK
jgi:hypothetical protein